MPPNHHNHIQQAKDAFSGPDGRIRRVCIIGHGRHGKDEAAMTLHSTGQFRYAGSTSWQALPFIAEFMDLPQQIAWDTRHQHREFWKSWCDEFRKDDPLRLVKLALKTANVVAGVRDLVEIEAVRDSGLFDSILWVNRPGFPDDPTVSYDPAKFATDAICNEGTVEEFRALVLAWARLKNWIV